MKKTMKTLLALMAGVMTFSACSNEDVLTNETPNVTPEVKGIRSFTAFTESNPATRATIDGMSVKWQSGDAIFVGSDNYDAEKYNLTSGEGSTSGTFTADGSVVSGSDIYAIYPCTERTFTPTYDDAVWHAGEEIDLDPYIERLENEDYDAWPELDQELEESSLPDVAKRIIWAYFLEEEVTIPAYDMQWGGNFDDVVLPSTQTVSAGQVVDPKAVLMVAKADEVNNLAFKNVCSYIKVTPTAELKKIVVSANNSEDLAAKLRVHISESAPTISLKTEVSSSVTFQALGGNLAPGTYYIAVLPGTLAGGLSIKFYTTETEYTESSINTPFTFERNKVYNAGSQPEASAPTTGTAAATIYGMEVDVNWVQLWENGPKFAEYNVGAYNSTEAGDTKPFTDAVKEGDEYLWGSNWCTPSFDDLSELVMAASDDADERNNAKVTCTYEQVEGGVWGFTFTGKEDGYTNNSVFFPTKYGDGDSGSEGYWSGTADEYDEEFVYFMTLDYGNSTWNSRLNQCNKNDYNGLVRPVLKEN